MIHSGTKAFTAYRKVILLAALTFILAGSRQVQAQVRLGVIGGLHSANILEKNNIPNWDSTVKPFQSSLSGFQLGVIVEVPLGNKGFFFQPAITYTSKGKKYAKNNDSATGHLTDTVYTKQNLHTNYIDVPLNITYKFYLSKNHKNSFFLSAGPQISFFYSGKTTNESLTWKNDSTTTYTNESDPLSVGKGPNTFKTVDIGINGRAGFELGNIMLSAYFSRGFSNIYHATYDGTFHHQVMGASLGIWLSSTGVPVPAKKKDTDMDGIPDDQDACPLKPGTAKWHGCPVPDTDHDGIDDDHDSCRNQPGLARYNGCPIPDTDHDGVNDEEDKCPNTPGLARYNGCPIPDRDGDGVNDEEDQCPDTPGSIENHGCPEIKKETKDSINYIAHNIMFNSSSDELTDSSYLALDALATLMKDHPEWHLTIEGYTDSSGRADKNLLLSQKRALAVKIYLIKKGIAERRLTATGLGQANPIADNSTPAGRAINRRVELKISQEGQQDGKQDSTPEIDKETTIERINNIAHNVIFHSSNDQFTDSSLLVLDTLVSLMKDHPEWRLTIEGYTDSSGRAQDNLLLSRKRALAVKNYLVKKGIASRRLTSKGFGQANPIADNSTPAGRAINRRIELKLSEKNN